MSFEQLHPNQTFCFACHPGIACFNACCRDLNQYLTPYDILRLKNNLGLSSQQFLDRYTECHRGPRSGLPVVSLRMPEENLRECPFVSPRGCTVYEDRPGACRTYPLGRMAAKKPGESTCRESFFLIREPHCLGFREQTEWTLAEWKKNQGLDIYNDMNDLMMEVISLNNRNRRGGLTPEEDDLFRMACYDLDRFHDFVLDKQLLKQSSSKVASAEQVLRDEVALMRFGIAWIKQRLFADTDLDARAEKQLG
jgi:uncharacterized protein